MLREVYTFFAQYCNYGTVPPQILTEMGVKFHSLEDYLREADVLGAAGGPANSAGLK